MLKTITQSQLRKGIGLKTSSPWFTVYVELIYSESGRCIAYINGYRTPFYAGGYGYNQAGVVLSEFLNYYAGKKISNNNGEGVQAVVDDALRHDIHLGSISDTRSGSLYLFSYLGECK